MNIMIADNYTMTSFSLQIRLPKADYKKTTEKHKHKVSASGRVSIIGEHVDYCGEKVFPAALSLKNNIYIKPNGTDKINLGWSDLPDNITLDIERLAEYKTIKHANYIAGGLYELKVPVIAL